MIIFNHRFPIDNAALLEKWLFVVKWDKFSPYKQLLHLQRSLFGKRFQLPFYPPSVSNFEETKIEAKCSSINFWLSRAFEKEPWKERNPNKRVSQALHPHLLSEHSSPKKPKFDHTYASNASTTKLKAEFTKRLKKKNPIIYNLRRKNLRREKTIKGLMFRL